MSTSYPCSSPIKKGFPPMESRTLADSHRDIREHKYLSKVSNDYFVKNYLLGSLDHPTKWSSAEKRLVNDIKHVPHGQEETLYTNRAPLLRLLNYISQQVFESLGRPNMGAVVFRAGNKCRIVNPYTKRHRSPDIIVTREPASALNNIDYSQDGSSLKTWYVLVSVGEAKVATSGQYQISGYLQNLLQLHPEFNAVLGFTARSNRYSLFYHDANVIQQSNFQWRPEPLYAFVARVYRPFQDMTMSVVNAQLDDPAWAIKIGVEVYMSVGPVAQAGPGQRRYTALGVHVLDGSTVFIKDVWRDERRLFFEAALYEEAHKEQVLAGLMTVEAHGYVLDETQKPIRTPRIAAEDSDESGAEAGRYKMRIVTKDVGRPLGNIRSLRHFLCVMYDACAVQRNLYRKSRILHRDISDSNIMVAPDTNEYRNRNMRGYAEVRFVNQVLAKDKNANPDPACLLVDLGNGADLKVARNEQVLKERTGTPKFIARSISCGSLLPRGDDDEQMPPLVESILNQSKFMHTTEYQVLNNMTSGTQPHIEFAHRLFHDAESTFWVIAWTLARSIKEGHTLEPTPHPEFRRFFHTMQRHFPTPDDRDSRAIICVKSCEYWTQILHDDLKSLGPMLFGMFRYILPEWTYRSELDPEHVHEALMRLLLVEIVRIDKEKSDVPLVIGGRPVPPPPSEMAYGPSPNISLSYSTSVSFAPGSNSFDIPHHSTSESSNRSKKRSLSLADEPQVLRRSPRLRDLSKAPGTGAAPKAESEEMDAHSRLRAMGKTITWRTDVGRLWDPAGRIEGPSRGDQDIVSVTLT
ncbi:hypothetical protein RhiTH_009916 [Rhizoctonia solani]